MAAGTSLCRIIYYSRCTFRPGSERAAESLARLIRSSKRQNEFKLITSIVLMDRGWFLQALEGERMAIQETFDRIRADDRHKDVMITEWKEVVRREIVIPFRLVEPTKGNEAILRRYDIEEALRGGRPKSSALFYLLKELQEVELAKAGIDALI